MPHRTILSLLVVTLLHSTAIAFSVHPSHISSRRGHPRISTTTTTTTRSLLPAADLVNTDAVVFLIGVTPFAWATVEFWRRIAVGEPFGTGKDSITIIGKDARPNESRGRQQLGQGALFVAYILFGTAAGAILLTFYAILSSPINMDSTW